ncbi:TlpA family protein disulfide reductase [Micromonospora sp. NBC_01813]|uniref:TlpA family protein disulfide reductase n=1 Tax=Micromonospora sp. NBC_01813 TaxID=2975988 RepID=UPI002DDA2D0B|nr:TlpA disulfide reductase family protein [Micromonospora sp. NBC_01813]WSA06767.1 TlpA family protein disulfide reductase [Micromonospora sp. NBC_01813]
MTSGGTPGGRARPWASWRRALAALVVPLLLAVSGCAGGRSDAAGGTPPVPFADCAGLTTPPAGPADIPPAVEPTTRLPEVALPCFADGPVVDVAAIRGPAVINFWGSWCEPCRAELPALQRLADRTEGQLHLIGVNTWDDRGRALAVAEDLELTFASLVDRDRELLLAVERIGLPLTLFVDDRGEIRRVYEGAVDDVTLAELVEREFGLTVTPVTPVTSP